MNVLLLEDDPLIARSLQHMLLEFGNVLVAHTVESAFSVLDENCIDIALIDRILPDGDGIEVLTYLHQNSPQCRTLVVSGLSSLSERLRGWHVGADDYIAKPFSREEVRLRVKRLTLLQKETSLVWEDYADLHFNPNTGQASHQGRPLHFRPKEFALFLALWRHKEHTLTREELHAAVWGASQGPMRVTLDVYIRRIRIILKLTHVRIKTTHRIGYMLTTQIDM